VRWADSEDAFRIGCDTFKKVLDNPEEKYLSAERPALEQLLAKSRITVD